MQQTIHNLTKAFIGESQARNRYTYYSKVAKKEGFEQIAAIFIETAEQEKIHAKRLFEHIQALKAEQPEHDWSEITVDAKAPTIYGTTKENLQAAIDGEKYEYSEMYPEFAETAENEKLPKIAVRFKSIAKAEEHHAERYQKLLANLKANEVFKKPAEVQWVCRECGYIHTGKVAPEICPSCDHGRSYYQLKSEDY